MTKRSHFGALLAGALVALAACGDGAPPPPPAGDADYEARGEIARLPDASSPEIWIRHEAIPDFRDAQGEVVGMESMTMPFKLAPGVAVGDLAPGDRVSFRLEMRWGDRAAASVARIEKLPDGTRLAWESAAAPAPPAADQSVETPR
jgi:Cu/Ag efflux protein CusF